MKLNDILRMVNKLRFRIKSAKTITEKEKNGSLKNSKSKDGKTKVKVKSETIQQSLRRKQKEEQILKKRRPNRQILREYLTKAGLEHFNEKAIKRNIVTTAIIICTILTFGAIVYWIVGDQSGVWAALTLVGIWTAAFAGLILLSWAGLYFYLDFHIFNRTLQLETVLPDFLQLASANISAGMPIDRALWYAVRPNFGVLAKEIEEVAKNTVAGEDLEKALLTFSKKYESKILKRSVNILLEGLRAGGEMADLLNKIAINIQETRLMRKEMAANVMTYVIFIGFASVAAAPFLYGLATLLLQIVTTIISNIDVGSTANSFGISIGGEVGIKLSDFKWFCVVMLIFTSTFSSMITSVIRKGNIREGLRFIPIFIIITLSLYFLSFWMFEGLFSGLI